MNAKIIITTIALLFISGFLLAEVMGKKPTLSGFITDTKNGESLPGATVFVKELNSGTTSNSYGYFSLSLTPGEYTFVFSYMGYADKIVSLNLLSDTTVNIELSHNSEDLTEVEITDEAANTNITNVQMSVNKISNKEIKAIPALMGEVDPIKALQMLPGVKFVAEGSSGLSVRGGGPDQNLMLLDEATVYNAGHLMGFFSVFNNDAIKNVDLYKGDLPAKYGGRLSSLIDVSMKDGNTKEFHGNGGIGLISSRLMLEGPIQKDKSSFMVAGRRSYADLFLMLSTDENINDNTLYFYDLNAKASYIINNKNRVYLSGYFGKDVMKSGDFAMDWGNATGTVRWNHIFHEKLFSNFTFVASRFNYNLGVPEGNENSFEWLSDLKDYNFKGDFTWFANANNEVTFGVSALVHNFFPGVVEGTSDDSFINKYELDHNYALESGIYLSNEQKIGSLFILKYGVRFSIFNNIGPGTVYSFDSLGVMTDSITYPKGDFYNTYTGFEPRLGVVYLINEKSSVKASYSRNIQYIQQAQNSTAGSPLHVWFPSSPNVEPQIGDQYALGYFRNFKNGIYETSVEGYYKTTANAIDFRNHADLLLNKYFEGELLTGKGWSYGIEVMVKKTSGKLTGWASYCYSKTMREIPGINNNDPYPAPYDRPHDITLVANFILNDQLSFGATWTYQTGQPVTLPVGRYEYENTVVPVYSERNSYRMPDYHRLDLSCTYKLKPNPEKRWRHEFNFSIYNAYDRHNPYMVYFVSEDYDPNVKYAEMLYLFGIIPSFTYNFSF